MILQGSIAACIKSDIRFGIKDQKSFIATSINDVIVVWNSVTLEIIRILKCHLSQTFLSKFTLPNNIYTGKKYHPIDPFKRKENPDNLINYHISSITVDNSQEYLFAGCSYPVIIIYKLEDGEIYTLLRGHNDCIKSMLVFDEILYSCSDDCTFRSWNWEEGKLISNPPILTMNSSINSLSFHEEKNGIINRINLCCGDGSVVLYDIESERVLYECQFICYISNILTSGSTMIVSSTSGTIPVLNLPNILQRQNNNNNNNNMDDMSNNNDYKISCNEVLTSLYDELSIEEQQAINDVTKTKTDILQRNEELKSTNLLSSTPLSGNKPVTLYTLNHQKEVTFMVMNRKRDLLFTSSLDCTIKVWSLLLGKLLYTFELPDAVNGLDIMMINSDKEDSESYYIYCTCQNAMVILKIDLPLQILNFNFDCKEKYFLSLLDTIQTENEIKFPKLPQISLNKSALTTKTTNSLSISGLGTKHSPRRGQKNKTNISFINLYILACNTDFGLECVTSVINNPHVSQREIHSLYLYLQENQKVDSLSRDVQLPNISKQNKRREYISPRSQKYNNNNNSNILPSIILSPRRRKLELYEEEDDEFLCYGKSIDNLKENKKKIYPPPSIDTKPMLRKPPIRRTIPTIPHKTQNYNSITNHYSANKMKYLYRKPFHLSLAPLLGSYEISEVKGPEIHKCKL